MPLYTIYSISKAYTTENEAPQSHSVTAERDSDFQKIVDEFLDTSRAGYAQLEDQFQNVKATAGVAPFFNQHLYSDVEPYEIYEVASPTKIKVRSMHTKRLTNPEFVKGGFAGHCTNNSNVEWECTPNPQGHIVTITKRKNGKWCQVGDTMRGSPFNPSMRPRKHYDYNF